MRSTQIATLQERSSAYYTAQNQPRPSIGWISFIRQSLNMTLAQLGGRMNITKQAVQGFEVREVEGSLTLKSLNEAAKALDMKLVYAIIPIEGDIDQYLEEAAGRAAQKIVMRTHQIMKLEGQETAPHIIKKAVEEMTDELKRTVDRSIWA